MERVEEKAVVLFTGNGTLVIDDLMQHFPEQYLLQKCLSTEQHFISALKQFDPHVVIACLSDETRDTLRTFSVLKEETAYLELPVIAIGNEEDCAFFRKNVFQKNMAFFIRPLNAEDFQAALSEYAAEAMKRVPKQEEAPLQQATVGKAEAEPSDHLSPAEIALAEHALAEKLEKLSHRKTRDTILVVDDDVRMLNVIKLYLQELYDVVVVPSGKLAVKYLSKKPADLVLLDYMMPEEDGPTVLRKIRETTLQPDIPVLFLTGVSDKDLVTRGLEFNPSGYLLKPVTRDTLLEKVTELLLGL